MYCPVCGIEMLAPAPPEAPFPMFVCTGDGVVYDKHRNQWYGLTEGGNRMLCPSCGQEMDAEPRGAPAMHFCFQCGVTYDHAKNAWYGVSLHEER